MTSKEFDLLLALILNLLEANKTDEVIKLLKETIQKPTETSEK